MDYFAPTHEKGKEGKGRASGVGGLKRYGEKEINSLVSTFRERPRDSEKKERKGFGESRGVDLKSKV